MTAIYVAAGIVAGTLVVAATAGATVWALMEGERILQRRNRARTTGVPVLFGDAAVIARADKAGER
jgi:hypothetical protein